MASEFNEMVSKSFSLLQNESPIPSPFISFNPEIWGFILNKLKQKDALNLRLVNKDFKTKVDNLYENWIISLDEASPYLDMILDLHIKELKVVSLLNPVPNRSTGIIFKFPIMKITVKSCNISAQHLHFLLQSTKLKCLSISLKDSVLPRLFLENFDPKIGYDFPELENLFVMLSEKSEPSGLNLSEGNFYERLLNRSRMPKLKRFEVHWDSYKTKFNEESGQRLIFSLISFLSRHGHTLTEFGGNDYNYGNRLKATSLTFDFQNCAALKSFQNSSLSEPKILGDIWRHLIQIQSKLIDIYLGYSLIVSDRICAKICANNFKTLTKINVVNLRIEGNRGGRFDMSIFSQCANLKNLSLAKWCPEIEIELCNLSTCLQLERLFTEFLIISCEEISKFLKNSQCILRFEIGAAKKAEEYGVNLSILKEILNHSSLTFTELRKSIIVPTIAEEIAELRQICLNVECKDETFEQFKVKKITDSTWGHDPRFT